MKPSCSGSTEVSQACSQAPEERWRLSDYPNGLPPPSKREAGIEITGRESCSAHIDTHRTYRSCIDRRYSRDRSLVQFTFFIKFIKHGRGLVLSFL